MWRHILSLELISIVSPAVPQEVMLEAGSGAVKGKKAANTWSDGQQEGNVKRSYWNYCLFSLSVSEKRKGGVGGTTGMPFDECVPSIYSNSEHL